MNTNSGTKPDFALLQFSASWCGPCQQITPKIKGYVESIKDRLEYVYLDIDKPENQTLMTQFNITSVPTFVIHNKKNNTYSDPQSNDFLGIVHFIQNYIEKEERTNKFQSQQPQPQLTLMQFSAKWCGPCVRVTPLVRKYMDSMKSQVNYVYYDIDKPENQQICKKFGIRSVPTFIMYDGKDQIYSEPLISSDESMIVDYVEYHLKK
jgi:thioredoxin 1